MHAASKTALTRYVAGGSKKVSGWFARIDAEIFRAILVGQNERNLTGSAAEIGVHHGRSFIAMCLGLRDNEKGYCIDIFENQHLNKDLSGKGDKNIFEKNLAKFGVNKDKVVIDSRSSENVSPADIINAVGQVRIFSVDGGHWLEIVENDLQLAEAVLSDHGVIALDDFHRPEWPDVSAGYFSWYQNRTKAIVPFAIGFNKLYLCHRDWVDFYKNTLDQDLFISHFVKKMVEFQGRNIPIYTEYMLPEFSLMKRTLTYLRIFNPQIALPLLKLKNNIRPRSDST